MTPKTYLTRSLLTASMLAAPTLVAAQAASLSTNDIALINRVTWGVTSNTVRDAQAQGMEAWLQGQLHPASGDHLPPAVRAQIEAMPALKQSPMALARDLRDKFQDLKAQQPGDGRASKVLPSTQSVVMATTPVAKQLTRPVATAPQPIAAILPITPIVPTPQELRQAYQRDVMRQVAARRMFRDLYSSDQLREQMTWFWFNHFNVFLQKAEIRLFLADYEDRALRPNALGNFRTLLEATLRSPAMLQYLDNFQNASGKINENYAREIMELHTMGVGSGYTQKDVQELARILTGVSITRPAESNKEQGNLPAGAIRDGMFAFYPARHDFGDKLFLGHIIKGSGYHEVEQALDLLAENPATAQHISKQLAQFFVADDPPKSLVTKMAARFSESRGDIAAVLDLMFHSNEFRASLRKPLLKDPQHYVLSAVRMAYEDKPILNPNPALGWLIRLGEPLYGHLTPDGYALERTAWNGPGQIEQRFEVAQAIGNGAAGLFKGDAPDAKAQPAYPQLQNALYFNTLAPGLATETRNALAQATSPQEWNVLYLASPDFMRR